MCDNGNGSNSTELDVAHEVVNVEDVSNIEERRCSKCEGYTTFACIGCSLPFCHEHRSESDPDNFCCDCMSPPKLEIKTTEGLVDEDGVRHKGRLISVTGETMYTSIKLISEMTDEELRHSLARHQERILALENALDYNRVMSSCEGMELGQREHRRKRLQRLKNVALRHHSLGFVSAQQEDRLRSKPSLSSADGMKQMAKLLKNRGVSLEQLKAVLGVK